MKAHLYKEPVMALCWNLPEDGQNYAVVAEVCRRFRLPLRAVTPEEAGKTVEELLGLGGKNSGSLTLESGAYPAALVISGMDRKLSTLLDTLNEVGAQVPLKAIVTPTSRKWRFADLLDELARERAAVEGEKK